MNAMEPLVSRFKHLPALPTVTGHTWRTMRHTDVAALLHLEVQCAVCYGNRVESTLQSCEAKLAAGDNLEYHSLCAVDERGELAAAGIISFRPVGTEMRFTLDGNVAPKYCGLGLGTFLLQWMEAAAREALTTRMPEWRGVLCVDFFDRRDPLVPLCEALGFRLQVSEYDLRRSLDSTLPDCPLPGDLELASWTPTLAPACFKTYQEAFRERPGFPNWTEETWRAVFIECEEFQAGLTVLVLQEGTPVGYGICHLDTPKEEPQEPIGWIAQLGVVPEWRQQGVASAMLAQAMRRFRDHGLRTTALGVNINNPKALSVYLRLGYQHYSLYTSYRKPAQPLR